MLGRCRLGLGQVQPRYQVDLGLVLKCSEKLGKVVQKERVWGVV